MKKSLIALAVLGLSGAAMAQSSVTLYGVADAGIGKIEAGSGLAAPLNDASDKTEFISGSMMNNGTSRLGVRGVEDLGGGLKAGFQFETGLDLDNGGNSGAFWSRQANIWLGGNWGTGKLGRQFTPSYLTTSTFELTGTALYSVLANTYNFAGIGRRANSAFAYITPNFGAFTATLDLTRDTKNEWTGKKYTNGVAELKYALSKRTFVYGAFLRLDDTNNYGIGVRHNF